KVFPESSVAPLPAYQRSAAEARPSWRTSRRRPTDVRGRACTETNTSFRFIVLYAAVCAKRRTVGRRGKNVPCASSVGESSPDARNHPPRTQGRQGARIHW